MLQIQNIKKQYVTGDLVQTALDGVSLTLRDNEFVAILGPSGSGKTTLLNVIGGLDRYDSGDLIINEISTKKYSDRDWDSYRNHTIGFVFQSYNLIPHQSVLSNVELALTISGISRSERRRRAAKALEDVGLGNQLHKKPNQMSGGQMQRVAIARALVNNPDILLADEPTGALDSETSIQVMDLLKEVSKDKLVVMVTHNPELAETYANRIVRVCDGKIVDDSNPYTLDTADTLTSKHKNMGRASMSFFTALALSFNNLKTKKGRTLLTAFAGSIGIIGIALIMSLSTGFQKYIDKIQEDTLTNYPLSIQSETADMGSAFMALGSAVSKPQNVEENSVVEQPMISQMFAQIGSNDLSSFNIYLEDNYEQVANDINAIKYSYGISPLIYSADTSERISQVNPGTLFGSITGSSAMSAYMDSNVFYEMIDNYDLLESQYDVVYGNWPQSADELIIVLPSQNQMSDYMAYTLGLKDPDGLKSMMDLVMQGQEFEYNETPMQWSYDQLMALEFRLVPAAAKYRYNSEYDVWEDMSNDADYMKQLIANSQPLKIVGIVCPKEGVNATILSAGVAYTSQLTQLVIDNSLQFEIVYEQLANTEIDVFTGKPFDEPVEDTQMDFQNMISIDEEMLSSAFGMDIDPNTIIYLFNSYMEEVLNSIEIDTTAAQTDFINTFSELAVLMLNEFLASSADPETGTAVLYLSEADAIVGSFLATEPAQLTMLELDRKYQLADGTMEQIYHPLLIAMITSYITSEMNEVPLETPEDDILAIDDIEEESEVVSTEPTGEESDVSQIPTEPTDPSIPDDSEEETLPDISDIDLSKYYASISSDQVDAAVQSFLALPLVEATASAMSGKMMEPAIQSIILEKMSGFTYIIMNYIGNSFSVDADMISASFQFNLNEEELRRLMEAMSGNQAERSSDSNLRNLGYADTTKPTSISIYFVDFASKESFLAFLDDYNLQMESSGREDQVITYTDITNIMMSSVRTIIDSVSYVLIAFVAVSLVVSSIMIGIITYISVMERTKEIGILRAIGASKRNISQVFNAETFIIGLCSGLIGIACTLLLNIPINQIIYSLTDNPNIHAQLPVDSAIILVILSMVLTLIGGLIPSKHAAQKDPVIALRSE